MSSRDCPEPKKIARMLDSSDEDGLRKAFDEYRAGPPKSTQDMTACLNSIARLEKKGTGIDITPIFKGDQLSVRLSNSLAHEDFQL